MKRWQKKWAAPSPPLIWTKSKRSAVFPQETFPQPKGCFGVLYFSNYIDCKSIKCFCSKCIILLQDRDVFHDRVISSVGELVPLRSQRTAPIDCFCWSNTLDQGESTWESLLCSTSWVLLESTYVIYINCYLLIEIEDRQEYLVY